MGIIDAAITVGLTSFGFVAGFLARGLFADIGDEEWPAMDRGAQRYEPPRPAERV